MATFLNITFRVLLIFYPGAGECTGIWTKPDYLDIWIYVYVYMYGKLHHHHNRIRHHRHQFQDYCFLCMCFN